VRLRKKGRSQFQNLIGSAQLFGLALVGGHSIAGPFENPVQGSADLVSNRFNGRLTGFGICAVLEDHAHSTLTQLGGKFTIVHVGSFFSRVGASTKPGPNQAI
jgi:hypothetical protein